MAFFPQFTGFGQQPQTVGTTTRLVPVAGSEQVARGGVTTTLNTKLQCLTAMPEYEGKSLEELRLEDYSITFRDQQGKIVFQTKNSMQYSQFIEPADEPSQIQCISAMPEYTGKSLEEIRLEDYMAAHTHAPHNPSQTNFIKK